MTLAELESIVSRTTFRGLYRRNSIHVEPIKGGVRLSVTMPTTTVEEGKKTAIIDYEKISARELRTWQEADALAAIRSLARALATHEVDESIHLGELRVFDPHLDEPRRCCAKCGTYGHATNEHREAA